MSPLFAALPPADLPTVAYDPPALHTMQLLLSRSSGSHTVRSGDTVYDIAAKHDVSVAQIVKANKLKDNGRWIMPGDELVIPGKGAKAEQKANTKGAPAKPAAGQAAGGTVTVRAGDTLSGIALRHGTTVSAIAKANDIRSGSFIYPGQKLVVPGAKAAAPAKSTAKSSSSNSSSGSSAKASGGTVTVRAGDTLSGIALRHGTTVSAIAKANDIRSGSFIYPGQKLVVPGAKAEAVPAKPKASSKGDSAKGSSGDNAAAKPTGGTVTVRAGDTLSGLALRYGTTVSAIAKANDIRSGSFIYPGQKLVVPGTKAQSTSTQDSAKAGSSSSSKGSASTERRSSPWDESNIGSYKAGEYVVDTFLHYRYSNATARAAAANRDYLASVHAPSQAELKKMIVEASKRHGVDSKLMLALSFQESSWNMRAVSPANAIGAMQVIPSTGKWVSGMAGRELNLLDPRDNVEAGVVFMKYLIANAPSRDHAIGAYYQGLGGVRTHGLLPDTKSYVAKIKHHMRGL